MEAGPSVGSESSADEHPKPMTPPTSEEGDKNRPHTSSSELSDLELDDDDDAEIEPDHYYDGGKIPVFKPTMDQFRHFDKFMTKIDHHGMKSGIVKVVPPQEWIDALPALDEATKSIKINRPITQEFSGCGGMHGTFTQANIEKQRSYNLPQWKALTEEPQHQPPARRGERRRNHEKANKASVASKPKAAPTPSRGDSEPPTKKRKGRPPKKKGTSHKEDEEDDDAGRAPPTPTSPNTQPTLATKPKSKRVNSPKPKGGRTATTVAERRKYNLQMTADEVDEEAFRNFDYRFPEKDEFTHERCQELETAYWKSLTYAPPMYGADMPGSLFEEECTSWNVAKLPNLLDVLGTKVPGVNTAYLYLGMWKATYAWHLEDVDLYSINYIHFGAPKQWYSISQEDARKFEAAMRDVWPNDAKHCSQFLRHKTYLISPSLLKSKYNITVNKLVHSEGEFVITFPYGYHSGYNLGYNCAESVNFATEAWLDYGRIAKKCDCEADSVWVDVGEIERKLRGEPTPEYYEETDEEEEDPDDGSTEAAVPVHSVTGKGKGGQGKKKRSAGQAGAQPNEKKKKIKIRFKRSAHEPCCLCPNDLPKQPLLPTDNGKQAHELCAQYTEETTICTDEAGQAIVKGVLNLPKGRLDLKCSFCRNKKGACFQCSEAKCVRAYHATCALAAGVRVQFGATPVYYGEDGTEYYREQFDFRCRFHRTKRPKVSKMAVQSMSALLETRNARIVEGYMKKCAIGDVVQAQIESGDIFAGELIEKRVDEGTVLVKVVPDGDEVEVELKWIWAPELEDYKQPKPSPNAKPLPAELFEKLEEPSGQGRGPPRPGDCFTENSTWAEFDECRHLPKNPAQVKVNLERPNQLWYYLPRHSTDTKPQYTEDVLKPRHNPLSDIHVAPPTKAPLKTNPTPQPARTPNFPLGPNNNALNGAASPSSHRQLNQSGPSLNQAGKPYDYKPKMAMMSPASMQSQGLLPNFQSQISGQPWSAQAPTGSRPDSYSPSPYAPPSNRFEFNTTNPAQRRQSQSAQANAAGSQRRLSATTSKSSSASAPSVKPDQSTAPTSAILPSLPEGMTPWRGPSPNLFSSEDPGWRAHLDRLTRYSYLRNAAQTRPTQYRSPYPRKGGPEFSENYARKVGVEIPQYKAPPPTQSRPGSGSSHSRSNSLQSAMHRPGNPKPQNFFPFSGNTTTYQQRPSTSQPRPSTSHQPQTMHKHSSSLGSALAQLPQSSAKPIKRESFGAATGLQPSAGVFQPFSGPGLHVGIPSMSVGHGSPTMPTNAMSPTMMARGDVHLPQMSDLH